MNTEWSSDAPSPPRCSGAAESLDEIVTQWQRPLFAFAWRYVHQHADAEDLVIETFVRWHEHRERLRPDTNAAAWLFTTLANLCHNHHRWRVRHPEVALETPSASEPAAALAAASPDPGAKLESVELERAVRVAIDRLPHEQKTAVLLHHYEHLGYREIAAIVGCSERGVETRLYRARERLRTELAPLLQECAARR